MACCFCVKTLLLLLLLLLLLISSVAAAPAVVPPKHSSRAFSIELVDAWGDATTDGAKYMPMSQKCFQTLVDIVADVMAYKFFGGNYALLRKPPSSNNPHVEIIYTGYLIHSMPLSWRTGMPARNAPHPIEPFSWNTPVWGQALHGSYAYLVLHRDIPFYTTFTTLAHEMAHSVGFTHVNRTYEGEGSQDVQGRRYVMYGYSSEVGVRRSPRDLFGMPGERETMLKHMYDGSLAHVYADMPELDVPALQMRLMESAFYDCRDEYARKEESLRNTLLLHNYRIYDMLANISARPSTGIEFRSIDDIMPVFMEVQLDSTRVVGVTGVEMDIAQEPGSLVLKLNTNEYLRPEVRVRRGVLDVFLSGACNPYKQFRKHLPCVFYNNTRQHPPPPLSRIPSSSLVRVDKEDPATLNVNGMSMSVWTFMREVCACV